MIQLEEAHTNEVSAVEFWSQKYLMGAKGIFE